VAISVAILLGLFAVQRHGTGTVGRFFGPIIIVWFAVLALTGLLQVLRLPSVLAALNPLYAVRFLAGRGWHLFAAVGAIVLALTGAEALYADMGHFGKRPIRIAWVGLVLPALALNYFGQCAMLIRDPAAIENPFFHLFPHALLLPAVMLAAVATVIASQAVISGAYSMTKQAMQLGFMPRLRIVYTSAKEQGQVYIPQVNRALLVAVLAATVGFGSSSALAWAYGIAVTMTMLITTLLTFFVARYAWRLPIGLVLLATGIFALVDVVLALSCSIKLFDGGWFPLAMGLVAFTVMATWKRGREMLLEAITTNDPELEPFLAALGDDPGLMRAPRTAIYPVTVPTRVPQALLHNLKHNHVLHDRNLILTVIFHDVPWIPFEQRVEIKPLARAFWQVTINYGFKNAPDIPQALHLCAPRGLALEPMLTSYFLSRESIVPTRGKGMAAWRERLFALMTRNAGSIVEYFKLPDNAVVELGTRVQI